MGTTMPPPRSRKARQEVRAAELRVRPDAGKSGKGHAQQTTDSVGPDQLQRSDAIFFIDNEAACAAMIRGSSKEPDVGAIVNTVHWLLYQADCRAWFECKEVALKTLDLEEKRSEAEEKEDVGR